jgi:hypothetical protein
MYRRRTDLTAMRSLAHMATRLSAVRTLPEQQAKTEHAVPYFLELSVLAAPKQVLCALPFLSSSALYWIWIS